MSGCDDPVLLGMLSKQQVKAEEAKKVRVVDSQDCSGMVTVWRPGQIARCGWIMRREVWWG